MTLRWIKLKVVKKLRLYILFVSLDMIPFLSYFSFLQHSLKFHSFDAENTNPILTKFPECSSSSGRSNSFVPFIELIGKGMIHDWGNLFRLSFEFVFLFYASPSIQRLGQLHIYDYIYIYIYHCSASWPPFNILSSPFITRIEQNRRNAIGISFHLPFLSPAAHHTAILAYQQVMAKLYSIKKVGELRRYIQWKNCSISQSLCPPTNDDDERRGRKVYFRLM